MTTEHHPACTAGSDHVPNLHLGDNAGSGAQYCDGNTTTEQTTTRAPYPHDTHDGVPQCPTCGDGRLMLIEGGYERGWYLRWEEMDDQPGKYVLFADDDGWGDEGDDKYFVRCASCLAEYAAPEAGPEEEDGWSWA